MMKKFVAVLLAVSLLCGYAVPVNAAETTGKCGDNLTWTLVDRTLTISGTGAMYDYSDKNPAPWKSLTTDLQRIDIEHGVTSIGSKAFQFEITSFYVYVTIPSSVTDVGDHAFFISTSGYKFTYYMLGDAPNVGVDPFRSIEMIYAVNWSAADKKRMNVYKTFFTDCSVQLNQSNSQQFFDLNAPLKAEHLAFSMCDGSRVLRDYIPRQLSFGSYDNSTYGEKTVTVTADGFTSQFRYYVTDGANHLDMINVEFPELPQYDSRGHKTQFYPTVTMNSRELVYNEDYTLEFAATTIGNGSRVTVKGKGVAQGFEKTFYYPILKRSFDNDTIRTHDQAYAGMPLETHHSIAGSAFAEEGRDYIALYENNINWGTANIRAVGIGNHYGEAKGTFHISSHGEVVELPGECIGTTSGNLSDDIPYYQQVIFPAHTSFRVDCDIYHIAAYALYQVTEENVTLIEEYTSDVGSSGQSTAFIYDFKYVYEDAAQEGGEVYLLSYSWLTEKDEIYAGNMLLIIPSKAPDATSMTMQHVENDGDFRKEYFNLTGDDGVLGAITWSSSNTSIATVKDGTATLKKPGTVTITGTCGDLVETYELTAPQLQLSDGYIFDYSQAKGARVIYDDRLLTQGTDYVLTVKEEETGVTVMATGIGLFTGELMKTFDGLDSLADPHTHSFDNSCDGTCNGCDFTRGNDHNFTYENWSKNATHHYYVCTTCGQPKELFDHIFDPQDDTVCTICGPLHTPGDVNSDGNINSLDGLMLMRYLNGWEVNGISEIAMDVSGNGNVDSLDGLILMRYLNGWDIKLG